MEDERRLYRLNGVAHVARTINEEDVAYQLGLPVDGQPVSGCMTDFHLHIEGARPAWEWFQELFGELPPPDKRKLYTVHFTWFHKRFRVLPADASEETVRIYAHGYIMMLLLTQLFMDKSGNRVHLWWLPFVARFDDIGSYSWGTAALAWLYRCMCRVANRNITNLAGPLQLLQSWIFWRFSTLRPQGFNAFSFPLASRYSLIHVFFQVINVLHMKLQIYVIFLSFKWATYLPTSDGKEQQIIQYRLALDRLGDRDIVWEPYGSLDVLAVIHPEILTEEHSRLWRVDRIFPQLGGIQHLPEPTLNIEYLHNKDGRGGDRWFSTYYRTWHEHWDERVRSVLSIQRVADPGPSAEFLDWWYRVAHRILSPGITFADPRPVEVPEDAC
ncbi:serine/threonine-protein phosphatase 7 long form homolog [Arachis hypogaea]|uniref:serine/threonine-protein phosphatase 7 long form homolog n=1 Tax=Arachis hypogaea TaxID=3818 RepID=UPI003B20BDA4